MDAIRQLAAALAGRYELDREIGAGGMATVYLARDVKHNRRVAVKVLRPELGIALGAERFLAEIQVTANLQHPNLLPLFDSGEEGGLLFYVMPYVDGETLRSRLNREKQLPIDEALSIAVAIAGALEYAHGHGVIHRDLKPENILMQGGQPVVADFGIALALSHAAGERVTRTGMSLGTPQYMSPEQASGDRAVDHRADIFSLGAVIYEMLTGEPPHAAPTTHGAIAKLLSEEARSIATLRRTVPAHVDEAVLQALEKLPADRFTSARSFADALQGKTHETRPRRAVARAPKTNHAMAIGVSIAALLIVAVGAYLVVRSPATNARPERYPLAFQGDAKFSNGGGTRFALSHDGQLAYIGGGAVERLYLKGPDDLEPKPIPGTEGATSPQFSPDGQWIAFLAGMKLVKVRLPGGAPVGLADSVDRFSWGDNDDVIVVKVATKPGNATSLFRTTASGGRLEPLVSPDSTRHELNYSWPYMLPGSSAALFNIGKGASLETWELAAIRLSDRSIVHFEIPGLNPRYVSSGHMLYVLPNRTMMAVPFDARKLRITGPPVAVLENVRLRGQGATQFSVSGNGTLVYLQETPPAQLVEADRSGRLKVLLPDTMRLAGSPRYSPDGKHIAFQRSDNRNGFDIFIYTLATGAINPLTTDGGSFGPTWTADNRRVAWTVSGRLGGGARWQPWDASEPAAQLMDSTFEVQFARTGGFMMASTRRGLFVTTMDRPQQRLPLANADGPGAGLPEGYDISRDGKWLAYGSRGTSPGSREVFVRAIAGTAVRHQISTLGGFEPRWGATSGELFFRNRGWLWSASIGEAPGFAVVKRGSLFAMNTQRTQTGRAAYDVSRDGRSFLMPWFVGDENPPPVLVTNWFVELREKMAAAKAR